MVEFEIGQMLQGKGTKVIVASKADLIVQALSRSERDLEMAVHRQKVSDGIRCYHLGDYKLYIAVVDAAQDSKDWQQLGGKVYQNIKKEQKVKIALLETKATELYEFALGMELASYRFDKYFTRKKDSFYDSLEKVTFIYPELKDMSGYRNYAALANAVRYARDLINEPANVVNPETMAADIKRLEYLGLAVEIIDSQAMKEKEFNLASAVAQGSANQPRIVVIKWCGNKNSEDFQVGLVGKGVTFDSGGISIKPAANMGDMKQDMTGAAVVVATMKSLALQKVQKNVVAVVGLVENMPSGTAYRPGDVVRSMSGQTVEVVNTDAEGRLVLADCLTYIQRTYAPKNVIDVATLTGAVVVALGSSYAGMFGNNEMLKKCLTQAGEACGENVWPLPINEEYDKLIDSDIADMKNSGGRPAGSATAACFLQRFIEKNTHWAHLDVAGMDLSDGSNVLYPKGASAFGVRLLNKYINKL